MSGPRTTVWTVAQRPGRDQRVGRYVPESMHHPAKMLPALAAAAVETYTNPGDTVLDPMCGIGTTLVEAAYLGRDGFGIEYEPLWAELARANLAFARSQGASGECEVVDGDCRDLRSLVPTELVGRVSLILTSPPYGPSTHGRLERDGERVRKRGHRYSADCSNLAYVGVPSLLSAVEAMLRVSAHVLTPDGTLAMTARPWRRDGRLIDLPGALVRAGEAAGLSLVERNVALLVGLRDGSLVPRASFFQLKDVRRMRSAGIPQLVIAHEDVLVFRKHP